MEFDIDYEGEEYFKSGQDSGAYRLWLAVTYQAADMYKRSRGKDERARSFLFDENPFLEGVCHQLEIELDAMREQIKKRITSWHN